MKKVLILGGGLAGCTAADKLAENGIKSVILEKSSRIGGKVARYGCKADDSCNNCGMCLVKDLFTRVMENSLIEIHINAKIQDLYSNDNTFTAMVKIKNTQKSINDITDIIVASGFKDADKLDFYGFEVPISEKIIRGNKMENLMKIRSSTKVFEKVPEKVAFIQCYGSRDKSSGTDYCSRVCCNYSTRMARVLRKYYPEAKIDMFCMDMQEVEKGKFLELLGNEKINLIKSRPAFITETIEPGNNNKIVVRFEDSSKSEEIYQSYDYLILSDGIIANPDNEYLAEILGLNLDKDGFLKEVTESQKTGIYISGCAKMPMTITETYKMSNSIAQQISESRS